MWYKLTFAAVLSVASFSLIAEEEGAGNEFIQGEEGEDAVWEEWERISNSLVSIRFNKTPLDKAIVTLSELAGANIVLTLDGRLHSTRLKAKTQKGAAGLPAVTFKLTRVPFVKVVAALARSAGLAVELSPPVVYLTAPSNEAIGEIELRAGMITLTFDLTAQDVLAEWKRGMIHHALEMAERKAEMAGRKAEMAGRKAEMAERQTEMKARLKAGQRIDPDMLENLPPEMRERWEKMMKKFPPDARDEMMERMKKRGRKQRDDDEVPHDIPDDAAVF